MSCVIWIAVGIVVFAALVAWIDYEAVNAPVVDENGNIVERIKDKEKHESNSVCRCAE